MLNKNIRIVFLILIVVMSFWIIWVNANDLRDSIIPEVETISEIWSDANQEMWVISEILSYIKESIFWLLSVISIWMFIYVGFSLVKAQWNPEEMSKAWKTLIHVIVWLFLVAVSWALVAMVSWLKI
jgi:hypothetical protein